MFASEKNECQACHIRTFNFQYVKENEITGPPFFNVIRSVLQNCRPPSPITQTHHLCLQNPKKTCLNKLESLRVS